MCVCTYQNSFTASHLRHMHYLIFLHRRGWKSAPVLFLEIFLPAYTVESRIFHNFKCPVPISDRIVCWMRLRLHKMNNYTLNSNKKTTSLHPIYFSFVSNFFIIYNCTSSHLRIPGFSPIRSESFSDFTFGSHVFFIFFLILEIFYILRPCYTKFDWIRFIDYFIFFFNFNR